MLPLPGPSMPTSFFRYGESCHWFKQAFQGGEKLTTLLWGYRSPIPSAFEVTALSWQLFAKNADDLDRVLWECALGWEFETAKVVIGPLTQATGGLGDLLFPDDRGPMERLAETGNGLPSEEMWRILTQGSRIGDTYTFSGRMRYEKHPVMIPSGATCGVRLYTDNGEAITFSDTFRIRIVVHGVFKNVIEIG